MKRKSSYKLLSHIFLAAVFICFSSIITINAQSGVSVPQAVYDELAGHGYTYPEIARAYNLSLTLGSSPLEIIKFRPKDLPWDEYATTLQTYKKLRRVMKAVDDAAKTGIALTTAEGFDLTNVATKQDVIVRLHGADPGATTSIKTSSYTDEQALALMTMARL